MTRQKTQKITSVHLTVVSIFAVLLLIILALCFEKRNLDQQLDNLNTILTVISEDNRELTYKLDNLSKSNDDIKKLVTDNTLMVNKYGLNYLNQDQINNLIYILNNAPNSDYTWTLVSIAWKESRAGLWPININDPSCGIFHNKIVNVLKRENIEDTRFNRNVYCAKLINDIDFSLKHATLELDHWSKVHKGNWRKIWASYNGGNKGNTRYAKEVSELIKLFKNSNIDTYIDSSIEQLYSKLN